MMPFSTSFQGAHRAIVTAAHVNGMACQRADDIWVHSTVMQDIFSLLFRSFIVVCDFTGKNPNVFYEAGIAHALGKHVIPITQSTEDIPFDLRHHRYLHYLNNGEGIDRLSAELSTRIGQLLLQRK
jgi:nucleoside 2-deoxyribosyltransferase